MPSEAPIKHTTKIKRPELTYIKVECASVNGNNAKEQLNMHTGDDSPENYMLLVKSIQTLIKRHSWFDTADNDKGIKLAFETTNRALLDDPLDKWEDEVDNLRTNQKNTENGFKKCMSKLTENIYGEHAADNQKERMNDERKPNAINMNDFSQHYYK